jgi:transmembrane sensor
MQNRKKLTASFRRLFRKNPDYREKQLFARWFTSLDLSEGQVFADQQEELKIKNKIEQNLHAHFSQVKHEYRLIKWYSWKPVAAAAAMLVMVVGTIWLSTSTKHPQLIYGKTITRAGERKIITLSDGSVVTLNNDSQLKYPQIFSDTLREVYLEGEAFFEVSKNKLKPFVVKTGKLNIRVLGTSFNVKHYSADKAINVVVATGRVGVNASGSKKTWLLSPGSQLLYDKLTAAAYQNLVDPADYTGWQRNELIFKDERLEDICKRLERWYDIKISIHAVKLKNKRISLKQHNESLNTVLKMLAIVGDFRYKINGKTVDIWQAANTN